MLLTITDAPNVDAGTPIYICEGNTSADLNGSVSGARNTGPGAVPGPAASILPTQPSQGPIK